MPGCSCGFHYERADLLAVLRGDILAYRPTDDHRVFRKADEMPGLVTARLPNAAQPR